MQLFSNTCDQDASESFSEGFRFRERKAGGCYKLLYILQSSLYVHVCVCVSVCSLSSCLISSLLTTLAAG